MKKIKWLSLALLLTITQLANAADEVEKSIDANATREAVGLNAVTMVPLLVLVIFLIVVAFASQKTPGLES